MVIWIYDGNSVFYCDSDIKLDQCKSLVWESHVRQQIFVVFEDVYRYKGNKIQLAFDNKYPENNKRARQRSERGKNCTDEWFYLLCGVIMLWVKLC